MEDGIKLISNTFYLFLDWFIVSIVGFLFWSISGKIFNPSEYGIVTTSINISTLLSSISLLGLTTALSKLIPEYLAKNQKKKIYPLFKFSFSLVLLSNFVILFIFFIFSNQISFFVKITKEAVLLAAISIFILSLSSLFGSVIYAFQNMKLFLITDLVGMIAKIFLLIALFYFGFKYFSALIAFLISYLLISIFRYSKIKLEKNGAKINGKLILLEYAFPAFISGLAITVFSSSQYILISIFKSTFETGIFSVAMIISSVIATFPNILNLAFFPIASYLSAKNYGKRQAYLIELVLKYSLFLSLPIALFLIIFSKQVIIIFSSKQFIQSSNLIPILVFSSLLLGLGNIFSSNLYAIGKTKLNRDLVLVTTFSYLILAFILTPKLSSLGISISYLISSFLFFLLNFFFLKKFLNFKIPLKSFLKILISCLVSFLPLYLFVKLSENLILEILFSLLTAIFYLLILLFLKFYDKQDVKILKFFEERFPFGKKIFSILSEILERFI